MAETEVQEKQIKKRKFKLTPLKAYKLFLAFATGVLLAHFVVMLWWVPRRDAGSPVLGDRMAYIDELETSWITDTETFGNDLNDIDNFSIFWNSGPVVYFNVRVNEDVSRRDARSKASEILNYFVDLSDGVARDYELHVVISQPVDLHELIEYNHAAVTQHVMNYRYERTKIFLSHAEDLPTATNFNNAYAHVRDFENAIVAIVGQEGLDDIRARLDNIVQLTADEETALEEQLGVPSIPTAQHDRQVPPTNISPFPNFGIWNHRRSRINWN